MSEFPFPDLLASLNRESDKVQFLKTCAELELGKADREIGKLLRVLQLYEGYYETIPHQIKAVHNAALEEITSLRDEVRLLVERAASETSKIEQWAVRIDQSIIGIQPEEAAKALQKRLLDETQIALGGSVKELVAAGNRLDATTAKLNAACAVAEASIGRVHTVNLRMICSRMFAFCAVLALAVLLYAWFDTFHHIAASIYHEYIIQTQTNH